MNKKPSIKLNAVMNALLTVSTVVFQLITFPYISRILLPEGTGKISFATSLISYFVMLSQLGIPMYGIRACAKVRDDREQLTRTAQELLIINLVMSAISYLALFCCIITIPKLQDEKLLYVITSFTIILTSIGMEWLYKALEQYTYITIRSVIFKFIALVFTLLLVKTKSDYIIYGGISIFASSASYLLNFINVRKYIGLKPVGKYNFKTHIKAVLVFFAMACATTIYTHLDTLMLGFIKTDTDVGYYNAAVKIRTVLMNLVTSLGAVLLPRSTYYISKGQMERFYQVTKKAIHIVLLISFPLTLYFILFARPGVLFLSGNAYVGSIIPMQIIMPTLFLVGLSNIVGLQVLVPLGKEKIVLYSEIAGAVTDLVLNLILIPQYASSGAAIGTLVAEIVVLAVQYFSMRNEMKESFRSFSYYKIILALVAATLSTFWILRMNYSNIIMLVLSSMIFFVVYFTVLLLTKENTTREYVTQIINKMPKRKI